MLTFAVVTCAAATTIAGPRTPCAVFMPGERQTLIGYSESMVPFCLGQIGLLNGVPILIGLLAASSSRWGSGHHLVAIGFTGAIVGILFAVFGRWPVIEPRVPIHLLQWPVLTSATLLALLLVECAAACLRPNRPRGGWGAGEE